MTLDEIIVSALRRLDRGTDTQTIQDYRPVFTVYANKACKKIAEEYKGCRKEEIELDEDCSFNVNDLERGCYKIVKIRDRSRRPFVEFWQDPPGSGIVVVDTQDPVVSVTYRYVPKEMSSTIDVPEIPEIFHDIIPYYIVACERAGGDPQTQSTASVDYQLFNDQVARMCRSHLGEFRAYELKNY